MLEKVRNLADLQGLADADDESDCDCFHLDWDGGHISASLHPATHHYTLTIGPGHSGHGLRLALECLRRLGLTVVEEDESITFEDDGSATWWLTPDWEVWE